MIVGSMIQSATDVASNPIAQSLLGLVNVLGIAGVFIQGWRHRVHNLQETGRIAEKVSALNVTLRNHIGSTPTHEVCLSRMAGIAKEVRDDNERLIDKVTGLTIGRNGTVMNMDIRLRDVERWQAVHGDPKSGGNDELQRDD